MGDLWAFQGRKKKEICTCCLISFGRAGKAALPVAVNDLFFSSGIAL
jgi:hypothetical protein